MSGVQGAFIGGLMGTFSPEMPQYGVDSQAIASMNQAQMPINRDPSTPPPIIRKIGHYTVFMTPQATPKPPESPAAVSPKPILPPPVLPPPQQFKSVASSEQNGSVLGFFKNAITKVQNGYENCSEFDHHGVWNYIEVFWSSISSSTRKLKHG